MSVCSSWPLERFAKCVSQSNMAQSYRDPSNWKEITREKSPDLQVSYIGSNHLLISSSIGGQTQIHESFSLFESEKWLRAAVKSDSVLFMYKHKDATRRFRIKFSKTTSGRTSTESCRNFIETMSGSFSVKEVPLTELDSQIPTEDSQAFPSSQSSSGVAVDDGGSGGTLLSDIAKKTSRLSDVQKAYQSTNIPVSRLGLFIRLCLTDANFPAFVEAVEKELSDIVSPQ